MDPEEYDKIYNSLKEMAAHSKKDLESYFQKAENLNTLFVCQTFDNEDFEDAQNAEIAFSLNDIVVVNEYKYLFNRIVTNISLIDKDKDSIFVKVEISNNEFLIFRLLRDDWTYF